MGAAPHRAIHSACCSPSPSPPCVPHTPHLPQGPRGTAAGRIRRACFSFTGASWALIALLMLMAWEGTEEVEVRDPPGSPPGREQAAGEGAARGQDGSFPLVKGEGRTEIL